MKKLYFTTYQFNIAIFINELNKVIKKEGGQFVTDWSGSTYPFSKESEKTHVFNRYLTKGCFDYSETMAEKYNNKNIPTEYETESNLSYTSFILENVYYYIQIDENPFFDDYIQKKRVEPVKDKNYQYISYKAYYMGKISKELKAIYWKLYEVLTIAQIKNLAKKALELIKGQKFSEIVTNRQRVPNYYNNSYHYENIPEKKTTYYFVK